MNDLCDKFGDKLVILAYPCNQFGHQENSDGEEIIKILKHVRPGSGFEPKAILMSKIIVNGSKECPLFTWLKQKLPFPHDDQVTFVKEHRSIIWDPVKRTDVCWNFEKFLISPSGKPVRRYSKSYPTIDIKEDICPLLT